MTRADLFADVGNLDDRMRSLATDIWEHPELGLHEDYASSLLAETLETAGFDVERDVAGMETAFVASYGAGEPTVGILGEYDALPGLSQAVAAEREPLSEGGPGHGCGHNLFGTAGVGAALALARVIDRGNLGGTVRFYGCPAEETLVGKTFMARAGAFDDLDAAVTWHPSDHTAPQRGSSLALDSLAFRFEGTAAHAAASPESGRSALDAVQLLNTAVEYVREHVADDVRIHYSIQEGGDAPNVVPATASVWYYVRAPSREQVEFVTDWVRDAAEGAALMTRTECSERYYTGCHDMVSNGVVADVIRETMDRVEPIAFSEAQETFAADLQATIDDDAIENSLEDFEEGHRERAADRALYPDPMDATDEGELGHGSTEVGDVSHITPTAQFRATTWAVGTPAHSWQAVAANGSFGEEALVFAARVLAGTVHELVTNPERLAAAREEFEASTDEYESPLPEGVEPPVGLTE